MSALTITNAKAGLAACKAWRATARPLWWDSPEELNAVAAVLRPQLVYQGGVTILLMTDLQCDGGVKRDGSDNTCRWLSSGQIAPAALLRWYKVAGSANGEPYYFEPVLYVDASSRASVDPMGLIAGPMGTYRGAVVCRDGGA
jgi:hypothetical protein